MPELNPPIGVLGGTFDPIHNAHLRLAVELREQLGLARVLLIPSARPPHKGQPSALPGQRAKWIREAIVDEPGLRLDDRELMRPGLSYTVDTLQSLREDYPDTPICLIMGSDVFAHFDEWHDWQTVAQLAHLVVAPRSGATFKLPKPIKKLVDKTGTSDPTDLQKRLGGHCFTGAMPPLSISGTEIRELIRSGRSASYLLPERVWAEIQNESIYRIAE